MLPDVELPDRRGPAGSSPPIHTFLEHGIPVAVCTDNTTVSDTDQNRENGRLTEKIDVAALHEIHRAAAEYSFLRRGAHFLTRSREIALAR